MVAAKQCIGEKLEEIVAHSFTGMALVMGHQMGLFDHVTSAPRSAEQIAADAKCKSRYVREWLNVMVVAGLVECNQDGDRFWIEESNRQHFHQDSPIMLRASFLTMIADAKDKIKNCFPLNGPIGTHYSDYEKFYAIMSGISEKASNEHLYTKILPSLPNCIKEKLTAGCAYLDIGCGTGVQTTMIAKYYPNTKCLGVDLEEGAIEKANARCAEENLSTNLQFLKMDAAKLPKEWTGKFDYVTTFDAVHDQAFPADTLREIYRVLKPGGVYSLVDVDAHTNVVLNKPQVCSQISYTVSLFHCMPVSLGVENGTGLGTMWGRETAERMLNEAGFSSVTFDPLNDVLGNYHCISIKK